ncbi:MAG: hypothetical protein OEW87_14870 [Flavobacteriaceae bacterium]|nr:hypothetical protein [Flavobacteriaceae bacterium]
MISIEDFWEIDNLIKSKWGNNAYKFVNYCGLEPIRPMKQYGYDCTPKNSLTFATTGGNGVHFGLVNELNEKGIKGPIVMTVPMVPNANVIVAEDLDEFFSLGYHVGWFALEQIVYDLADAIDYFSKPNDSLTEEEIRFLELVKKELSIKHIPLSKERLKELEKQYFSQLDISDMDE